MMEAMDTPPLPRYEALHDGVTRLAARLAGGRLGGRLAGIALVGPDLAVFIARALVDERIPRATRGEIIASAVYIASPFEIVPAALFGPIGLVDDALVAARLLDVILNKIDGEVVRDLWPGDRAVLETLQGAAAELRKLFGAGLRQGARLLARRGAREIGRRLLGVGGAAGARLLSLAAPGLAPRPTIE
jgi:uncharacterized membrane protein YkvA (DUF1232 family)